MLLVVLSGFLSVSVYERYEKERATAERADARATELEALRQRSTELEENVRYLESERGIEEAIRDRYDAVRTGERAVIVMEEPRAAAALTAETVVEDSSPFSWLFFWR